MDLLTDELSKYGFQVPVLSETKRKGNVEECLGKYSHFWSGVKITARAKSGVSILISEVLGRKVTSWSFISEKIIALEMRLMEGKIHLNKILSKKRMKIMNLKGSELDMFERWDFLDFCTQT